MKKKSLFLKNGKIIIKKSLNALVLKIENIPEFIQKYAKDSAISEKNSTKEDYPVDEVNSSNEIVGGSFAKIYNDEVNSSNEIASGTLISKDIFHNDGTLQIIAKPDVLGVYLYYMVANASTANLPASLTIKIFRNEDLSGEYESLRKNISISKTDDINTISVGLDDVDQTLVYYEISGNTKDNIALTPVSGSLGTVRISKLS